MLRVVVAERSGSSAAPAPIATVPLSTTVVAAVRYDGDDGRRLFAARLEHLAELYGPLLVDGVVSGTWDEASATGLVVVGAEGGAGGACWGVPIGESGAATPAVLQSVLADPDAARALIGVWALAGWVDDGLRLVTTADYVHAFKRVDGPRGTAWATRGLAAHVLAGVRPRLADELIPELVLFDHVLGDRELLAATRVVGGASVVDIARAGARERSYWSLEDRLAPGPPTTAAGVRVAVGDVVRRLSRVDDLVLGLTAGRDSALLASCIAEHGGTVDTFTMGAPDWPDPRGAAAVAAALGWPHEVLAPPDPATAAPPSVESAVRWSIWTEGLEFGRDIVGPALPALTGSGRVLLNGLGGEAGRASYWPADRSGSTVDALLTHRRLLPAEQHERLAARIQSVLDESPVDDAGRSPLDVWYLQQRMRKWLLRSRPIAWVDGAIPGYLSPPMVRVLLDIPEAKRRTGETFVEAIDLGHPSLRKIVRAAVPPPPSASVWQRARRRLHVGQPVPVSPEGQLLDDLLTDLPGGTARMEAALGLGVLDGLRRAAVHDQGAVHRLWTVLSVEALGAALDARSWPD